MRQFYAQAVVFVKSMSIWWLIMQGLYQIWRWELCQGALRTAGMPGREAVPGGRWLAGSARGCLPSDAWPIAWPEEVRRTGYGLSGGGWAIAGA